jgi:uncharacterized protein YbbK (DUF523 family)
VQNGRAVFLCPEQTGGMSTPRIPAEIEKGKTAKDVIRGKAKVIGKDGSDLTIPFIKGAEETLSFCKRMNIRIAIMKENSPSCGSRYIYDGSFSGKKISGKGITAELLEQNGIKVYSEDSLPDEFV